MGFSYNVCVENILLEDQNSQTLIDIQEVTDFHGGFPSNIFFFKIKYWMDYISHEYLGMLRKYLRIQWDFLTIFYLKIKICGLLINIHEVMVFCWVSQHILFVLIDGITYD